MNLEELEEELENVLPNGFSIEKDNHGQIVIYTGLRTDDDGELVPFVDDEDEDEEFEGDDEEFEPLEDDDDEE